MSQAFYVPNSSTRPYVVKMQGQRFYFCPKGGYTSEEHAQRFADRLNERFHAG